MDITATEVCTRDGDERVFCTCYSQYQSNDRSASAAYMNPESQVLSAAVVLREIVLLARHLLNQLTGDKGLDGSDEDPCPVSPVQADCRLRKTTTQCHSKSISTAVSFCDVTEALKELLEKKKEVYAVPVSVELRLTSNVNEAEKERGSEPPSFADDWDVRESSCLVTARDLLRMCHQKAARAAAAGSCGYVSPEAGVQGLSPHRYAGSTDPPTPDSGIVEDLLPQDAALPACRTPASHHPGPRPSNCPHGEFQTGLPPRDFEFQSGLPPRDFRVAPAAADTLPAVGESDSPAEEPEVGSHPAELPTESSIDQMKQNSEEEEHDLGAFLWQVVTETEDPLYLRDGLFSSCSSSSPSSEHVFFEESCPVHSNVSHTLGRNDDCADKSAHAQDLNSGSLINDFTYCDITHTCNKSNNDSECSVFQNCERTDGTHYTEKTISDSFSQAPSFSQLFSFLPKLEEDVEEPWITSIISINQGTLVMADFNNSKVKVFHTVIGRQGAVHNGPALRLVSAKPRCLAQVRDGVVVATTNSAALYVLAVAAGHVRLRSQVRTTRQYCSLAAGTTQGTVIVSCCLEAENLLAQIDVVSLESGEVLRTLASVATIPGLWGPDHLATSPYSDTLWVSDSRTNTVHLLCLASGRLLDSILDPDMEGPRQVAFIRRQGDASQTLCTCKTCRSQQKDVTFRNQDVACVPCRKDSPIYVIPDVQQTADNFKPRLFDDCESPFKGNPGFNNAFNSQNADDVMALVASDYCCFLTHDRVRPVNPASQTQQTRVMTPLLVPDPNSHGDYVTPCGVCVTSGGLLVITWTKSGLCYNSSLVTGYQMAL